jgi:hypothetical protein
VSATRFAAGQQRDSRPHVPAALPISRWAAQRFTVWPKQEGWFGSTDVVSAGRLAFARPPKPQRPASSAKRSSGTGAPRHQGRCRLLTPRARRGAGRRAPPPPLPHSTRCSTVAFHPRRPRTVLLSLCADAELGVSERCRRGAPCPNRASSVEGDDLGIGTVHGRRAMDVGHHSTGRRSSAAISGELGGSPCKTSVPAASS